MTLKTGSMTKEELAAVLDTLPVDITFVAREDRVRYFNHPKGRIFPRAKAVIGRKVQQCHQEKNIPAVNQIGDDFRNRRRDVAWFWIRSEERLIYLRDLAVLGQAGEDLGCLEVIQDITDLKNREYGPEDRHPSGGTQ